MTRTSADGSEKWKGKKDCELPFKYANFMVPSMELMETLKTVGKSVSESHSDQIPLSRKCL